MLLNKWTIDWRRPNLGFHLILSHIWDQLNIEVLKNYNKILMMWKRNGKWDALDRPFHSKEIDP